jgi:MFS transporter, DHA3 family, tetracycline resistance protein
LKRLSASSVYLAYSASTALFFAVVFTANLIYQVTIVHLNPLQLVLVGAVLEASCFIFEIPTGLVADVYSRRLSIIIGVALTGVGFLIEGSFPYFGTVLLAQIVWGLGYTFTSGATEAWIADEVGEDRAGAAFVRGKQASIVGSLAGALVSAALGSIRINLPILAGGGLFELLALFLGFAMPEHGFTPGIQRIHSSAEPNLGERYKYLITTFSHGLSLVRSRPALITLLWVGLFYGLYSEGFDRLWTPHVLYDIGLPTFNGLKPVVWFGLINFTGQLLNLASSEMARRHLSPDSTHDALLVLVSDSLLIVAGLVLFALTRSFPIALLCLWVIGMARNLNQPYYTAWANRQATSEVRATVLSLSSQVDSLGQIAGGPILGVIGTAVSVSAALLGSAVMLTPALGLLTRQIQHARPNAKTISPPGIGGSR